MKLCLKCAQIPIFPQNSDLLSKVWNCPAKIKSEIQAFCASFSSSSALAGFIILSLIKDLKLFSFILNFAKLRLNLFKYFDKCKRTKKKKKKRDYVYFKVWWRGAENLNSTVLYQTRAFKIFHSFEILFYCDEDEARSLSTATFLVCVCRELQSLTGPLAAAAGFSLPTNLPAAEEPQTSTLRWPSCPSGRRSKPPCPPPSRSWFSAKTRSWSSFWIRAVLCSRRSRGWKR